MLIISTLPLCGSFFHLFFSYLITEILILEYLYWKKIYEKKIFGILNKRGVQISIRGWEKNKKLTTRGDVYLALKSIKNSPWTGA